MPTPPDEQDAPPPPAGSDQPAGKPGAHHLGEQIGRAVGRTLDATAGTVGHAVGKTLSTAASSLRGVPRPALPRVHRAKPGAPGGITPDQLAQMPAPEVPARVSCIDYGPGLAHTRDADDPQTLLDEPLPPGAAVRWINITSIHDTRLIRLLAQRFALHPLAVEDVMHVPQRPKAEPFTHPQSGAPQLFVVTRMLRLVEGRLDVEQVSLFVIGHTLITFQEREGDVFGPIRERIHTEGSRLRNQGPGYLLYAILDAIVDHTYPLLEALGNQIEPLEEEVYTAVQNDTIQRVHALKQQLTLVRREVWPMRDVIQHLIREEHEAVSEFTRTYLRDVYDHTMQLLELVETYREVTHGLADSYMTAVSNRMNEVMKMLTIIASIFIPISFLAGVFGMNFDNIPGLHHPAAFAFFCAACVAVAGGMLWWFRRKRWI